MSTSFFKNLTITFILSIFLYNYAFSEKQMFMEAPRRASQLDRYGFILSKCVIKERLSAKWLNSSFNIKDQTITDDILNSVSQWNGSCPCPYNIQSDGKRCGGSSHYSKTNSLRLSCYPKDVLEKRSKEKELKSDKENDI